MRLPAACSIVEGRAVALLGSKIKADPYRFAGQCRWVADARPTVGPTDLTINLGTRLGPKATVSAQAGSAVVLVPQDQSLPEWKLPKLTADQSFSIRLRYTYPKSATRVQQEKADANALRDVIALAEALAEALRRATAPSG